MVILGIFGPGPNPSAALLINGEIIAWAEEERFNRIKTAPNSLPIKSAKWCLDYASINLDDVKTVGEKVLGTATGTGTSGSNRVSKKEL